LLRCYVTLLRYVALRCVTLRFTLFAELRCLRYVTLYVALHVLRLRYVALRLHTFTTLRLRYVTLRCLFYVYVGVDYVVVVVVVVGSVTLRWVRCYVTLLRCCCSLLLLLIVVVLVTGLVTTHSAWRLPPPLGYPHTRIWFTPTHTPHGFCAVAHTVYRTPAAYLRSTHWVGLPHWLRSQVLPAVWITFWMGYWIATAFMVARAGWLPLYLACHTVLLPPRHTPAIPPPAHTTLPHLFPYLWFGSGYHGSGSGYYHAVRGSCYAPAFTPHRFCTLPAYAATPGLLPLHHCCTFSPRRYLYALHIPFPVWTAA